MPIIRMVEHAVRLSAASPTLPAPSTASDRVNNINARDTQEIPGTIIAGLAVLIALFALLVGILQLRNERQKRREARELEHEFLELEAEITEVRSGVCYTPDVFGC
jgi:hypothetical protein